MHEYNNEISLAVNLAKKALSITEYLKTKEFHSYQKSDNTPVTIADLASQIYIVSGIKEIFPKDQLIAEESNVQLLTPQTLSLIKKTYDFLDIKKIANFRENLIYRGSNSNRQWTIDPIDGTMGYKKGLVYAIGIGFMENYIPKASIIAVPSFNNKPSIIYKAIDKRGAWSSENSESFKKINVSNQKKLNKAILCHSLHYDSPLSDKFIEMAQIKKTIAMDSMVKFCKVAEGSNDIYFRPLTTNPKIWDFCPGDLLVREAGGKIIDFFGNSFQYEKDELVIASSGFFASNKVLHTEILELLEKLL